MKFKQFSHRGRHTTNWIFHFPYEQDKAMPNKNPWESYNPACEYQNYATMNVLQPDTKDSLEMTAAEWEKCVNLPLDVQEGDFQTEVWEERPRKCNSWKRWEKMYFALNKATDFFNSLGIHIWIIRVWQGHYVPIQYKNWGQRNNKKGTKKTISVTFVFSLVYLVWGSLVYNIYHHVFQMICWTIG